MSSPTKTSRTLLHERGILPYRSPEELAAWHSKLQRVAAHLKEHRSSIPLHAQRAAKDPGYWLELADSCPNLLG